MSILANSPAAVVKTFRNTFSTPEHSVPVRILESESARSANTRKRAFVEHVIGENTHVTDSVGFEGYSSNYSCILTCEWIDGISNAIENAFDTLSVLCPVPKEFLIAGVNTSNNSILSAIGKAELGSIVQSRETDASEQQFVRIFYPYSSGLVAVMDLTIHSKSAVTPVVEGRWLAEPLAMINLGAASIYDTPWLRGGLGSLVSVPSADVLPSAILRRTTNMLRTALVAHVYGKHCGSSRYEAVLERFIALGVSPLGNIELSEELFKAVIERLAEGLRVFSGLEINSETVDTLASKCVSLKITSSDDASSHRLKQAKAIYSGTLLERFEETVPPMFPLDPMEKHLSSPSDIVSKLVNASTPEVIRCRSVLTRDAFPNA